MPYVVLNTVVNQPHPPITRVHVRNDIVHVLLCFLFGFEVASPQVMFILLKMLSNILRTHLLKFLFIRHTNLDCISFTGKRIENECMKLIDK